MKKWEEREALRKEYFKKYPGYGHEMFSIHECLGEDAANNIGGMLSFLPNPKKDWEPKHDLILHTYLSTIRKPLREPLRVLMEGGARSRKEAEAYLKLVNRIDMVSHWGKEIEIAAAISDTPRPSKALERFQKVLREQALKTGDIYRVDAQANTVKVQKRKNGRYVKPDFPLDALKPAVKKFLEKKGNRGVYYLHQNLRGSHERYLLFDKGFDYVGAFTFRQGSRDVHIAKEYRNKGLGTLFGQLVLNHSEHALGKPYGVWSAMNKEAYSIAKALGFKEAKPGKPFPKRLLRKEYK